MDKSDMIRRILHLTVDIIYLLTGEEYCVVHQRSGERLFPSIQTCMLLPWNKTLSSNQEKNNELEILELAKQIIHLLTEEGEDLITVKVEVTEKELFGSDEQKCEEEEIPDGCFGCPSPLHAQDSSGQINNVPHDEKEEILKDVRTTMCQTENKKDRYQKTGELCKEEELPTNICTGGKLRVCSGGYTFHNAPENEDAKLHEAHGYDCSNDTCEESPVLLSKHEMEDNLHQGSPSRMVTSPNPHLMPPGCGKPFNTTDISKGKYLPLGDEYSITVTLQQDNPEEEKPFCCPECGKGFTKKSSLVRHQIIHMGEKPFLCTICSKCFARKSTLVEHEKTHSCEKPYACSDCGKCFVRKANLLDHQRIHTGERSFSCTVCGKCFTNKTILVRHQKGHSGERPFSCLECGKCFGHKSVLVKHQIVHTGEKPFPCSECGKCFTQKGNLMEHQKIHTGERTFFCSYCGKYFTNKAVLMRHQVTHSKQRPFTCLECGKCFMHKANLVKHDKSHLTETPP